MKKYNADIKSLNFLRVFIFILTICIILLLKYLSYYFVSRYQTCFYFIEIAARILSILLLTAYVVFVLIILPLWYRSVSYTLTPDEIILRSGIVFKNTTYIKMSSVQYITTVMMPFSRQTSFNFLLINAYGGIRSCVFLSVSDMEEISKKIQFYLSSRGGI